MVVIKSKVVFQLMKGLRFLNTKFSPDESDLHTCYRVDLRLSRYLNFTSLISYR